MGMKMDLTVLILNDNAYGMIKWKQVRSSACASSYTWSGADV